MSALIEDLYQQHILSLSPGDQLLLMDRIVRGISSESGGEASIWAEKNKRRGELIYQEVFGTLSDAEQAELAQLQQEADAFLRRVAPRPLGGLERLERELIQQHTADGNDP